MHFYEIDIAKAMKHRKPFVLNPTNYILTTDDELYQLPELPAGVPYITQEQMVEKMYKEYLVDLEPFTLSRHNQDVYLMAIYTSEFYSFHWYINTEEQYTKYREEYPATTKDSIQLNYWKYNLGDCAFSDQLSDDQILVAPHKISDKLFDFEMNDLPVPMYRGDFSDASIIINESLVKYGHYLAIQEGIKLFKASNFEQKINKTANFIFYADVNNDLINRSIMMKQTVKDEILYKVFPELKEGDIKFDQLKFDLQQRSFHEQVNYWLQEIDNNEKSIGESIFEHYYKTEYHAIEALAENIDHIATDLLPAWKKSVADYIETDEESTALFYLSYVLSEFEEQKQEYLQEIKEHLNMIEQAEQQQEESQGNLKMVRNILMVE